MSVLKVTKNTVHFYRRETFVEEGEYLVLPPSTKNKPLDRFLGVLHTDWHGYSRIIPLPLKPLVKTLFSVSHDEPAKWATRPIEISERDREWQKKVFAEINEKREAGLKYRKQINAGLGAGKTYLALKVCASGNNPLVLCPPSIWSVWREEAEKFGIECPELCTYESARKLEVEGYDVVILDEVLKVKNPNAKRTQEVRRLCANAEIVLGLTGTPMAGKDYLDLRTANTVGNGEFFPDGNEAFTFGLAKSMVEVEHRKGEKHAEVYEWNTDLISLLSAPIFRTVEISDLMKQIPEKVYEKIICSTPRGFFDLLNGLGAKNDSQAVSRARECTDGFVYDHTADGTRYVRKLSDAPKLKELKFQIEKYQSLEPPEHVVVWVNFQASQKIVKEELENSGFSVSALFSESNESEQGEEIRKFKSGETQILVASANLSEGLNLQEVCRIEIFFSNSFSPVKREQAEGRVFRPGQKKQTKIIDLVCAGTLDEKLLELLKDHKEMSEAFISAQMEAEIKKMMKN